MTEQELKEVFELMERSGMNPQLCDTPVPCYENYVKAGVPADPGDAAAGDSLMLPRSLVGLHPTFIINVSGDSMRDAGILEGDQLQVQMEVPVNDGDVVMASVNGGECTVKAFCTDEQGQKWLVPCNEGFDAILLTEETNVRIVGKVVKHIKGAPRVSFRDCLKTVRRTRENATADVPVSRQRAAEVAATVAADVKSGRQWYAVYRGMVDRHAVDKGDYEGFVTLVLEVVSGHKHLPVASELQRMAVQSFAKPVDLWDRNAAPVSGGVFDTYLRIAKKTKRLLK